MYDPEIHHRHALRLRQYDYSAEGAYYISVCTESRISRFGAIRDGQVILNEPGIAVEQIWCNLPFSYPQVLIDEFILMPNHLHGIIFIQSDVDEQITSSANESLSQIVGAFKSLSTNAYIKGVRKYGWPPYDGKFWQSRFYDHIIRDEPDLVRIREYIRINPAKWDEEKQWDPDL